jgi:malonate decarboxylase beta subunit
LKTLQHSFYEASARDRVSGILDKNSFREFCGARARNSSPHLPGLGMPIAFDDGVVVGEGAMEGHSVLIAAQEGRFMGGSVGEVHGAKLTGLLERAVDVRPQAVILALDTGGVRLQEANAGLIAMGEIQRATLDARAAGVPIIVAIGGSNGSYGGMSIVSRCCDWIVASEHGRMSISGPEVIEAVEGIEEFDSQDRALVWRTMGAKHRRLLGEIDVLVPDSIRAFRSAIATWLGQPRPFNLEALEVEHALLAARLDRYAQCRDGFDVWKNMGISEWTKIPALDTEGFNEVVADLEGNR